MRRAWVLVGLLLLVGCDLAGTPTPGRNGTATRGAELTQVASVLTPSPTPTATSGSVSLPTITPAPLAVPMVVTVKDNPINVRQSADQNSPIITTVAVGLDLFVLGPDTTDPDGAMRWVHVAANDTTGYVRSDLVSAPHVPPTPTPTVSPVNATSTADTVRFYASVTAIANSTPVPTVPSAQATGTAVAAIKSAYPAIDAADLAKRPDFYKGKQFRITGRIANVAEQNGITAFVMFAETGRGGTVSVAVGFKGTDTHIQEDVRLLAYCTGVGTIAGKNGFGASVTEAACTADYLAPG